MNKNRIKIKKLEQNNKNMKFIKNQLENIQAKFIKKIEK